MTVSTFNRRLTKLNATGEKLANVNTWNMTNSQDDTHNRKVTRNNEAITKLITEAGEEVYNDSIAHGSLCAEYSDWVA